jgi:hypothetical protein
MGIASWVVQIFSQLPSLPMSQTVGLSRLKSQRETLESGR